MKMEEISWDQFQSVELRAGTIISVDDFPKAHKPAYIVRVDFGKEIGVKKCSAQITDLYQKDELIGKQIVGVINLPPKQIGPIRSEFLLTGFYREDGAVVIVSPESRVPDGAKLG